MGLLEKDFSSQNISISELSACLLIDCKDEGS